MYRGTIKGFEGSWGSGIAFLLVDREIDREAAPERERIPCDNGPTVRALDAAYPGFIAEGHTVDSSAITEHEIYYAYDDMGLMLAGFSPVEEASEELEAAWEATRARETNPIRKTLSMPK